MITRDSIHHSVQPWYALQVWSRQEPAVAATLTAKGFTVFAPSYTATRLVSGRKRKVELALFPGYLFCRMYPEHRLQVITAPGVISILGNRIQATPVADEEVEAVRRAVDSKLKAEPCGIPSIGQRVILEAGPLAGVEGVLVSHKGQSRLVISVELLNRSVAVEIEEHWVTMTESAREPLVRASYAGSL